MSIQSTAKTSRTPKHIALQELLLREIREGRWGRGHRVPPERTLVNDFNVSITTVRRCLSDLVNDGYLVRYRRRGTFVTTLATTRAMRTYGLLCDSLAVGLHSPFLMRLIALMEQHITVADSSMRLLSAREYERCGRAAEVIAELAHQRGFDGLFVASPFPREWIRELKTAPGMSPLLALQIDYANLDIPCIFFDIALQMRLACEHLLRLGHRHLSILFGKSDDTDDVPPGAARRAAAAMAKLRKELKAPPARIDFATYRYFDRADILRCVNPLLKAGPNRPTAIIVTEEGVAQVIHDLARDAGWRVPHDLSIISLETGTPYSTFTAVEPQIDNLCWRAVRIMEQQIAGGCLMRMQECVGSDLVLRETSAPPPKN